MKTIRLYKNWWLLSIKGILAIVFGFFALLVPGTTLITLMIYFGLIIAASGIFMIIGSLSHKRDNPKWKNWLLEGLLNLGIGLVMVFYSEKSVDFFIIILAIWAISVGFTKLVSALNTHTESRPKWLLMLNSLIVIIFSIILFINPFESAIALTYLVGIFAIIFGIFLSLYSINLRNLNRKEH